MRVAPFIRSLLIPALLAMLACCGGRSAGINSSVNDNENGGDSTVSPSCEAGTCPGCCNAQGQCVEGNDDGACGSLGQLCADCAFLGGYCEQGVCLDVSPCGPNTCPGCCDSSDRCLPGTTVQACGESGAACDTCIGLETCLEGRCCLDQDGDGYGEGCSLGGDCDDNALGIVGPCQPNGCPQGWAYIPAGVFTAGCSEDPPYLCGQFAVDEQEMYLDAYCIEITEVLVVDYRACQAEGICGTLDPIHIISEKCNWHDDSRPDRPNHPMNCLSFAEMISYCQQWLGGELPTEWQWEKAARGTDGRPFPWGNEPIYLDCSRCNYYWCLGQDQEAFTWPVGYLTGTEGDSPYGLKDMCGNVLEVTSSCLHEVGAICTPEQQNLDYADCRGGYAGLPEWAGNEQQFTSYFRSYVCPATDHHGSAMWGLRCMREPVAGP